MTMLAFATLLHGIFTLVKIGVLALAYGFIFFIAFQVIVKRFRQDVYEGYREQKWKLYKWCYIAAYAGLLLFSFTYWGNHGLGDSAKVPVGYRHVVSAINSQHNYLEVDKSKYGTQLLIGDFAVRCGIVQWTLKAAHLI